MNAVIIVAAIIYAIINGLTAKLWNAEEMKRDFIDGQCAVGKVFANIFYAPAWFLKGVRFVIVHSIK